MPTDNGGGHLIPNTNLQWAWDSTSLGYLKECPRKYKYMMVDGWSPRATSVHLVFGQIYHTAIEHYAKATFLGAGHEAAMEQVVAEALLASWPWPFDHELKTRVALIRTIIWYLDQFRDAKTVLLADGQPAVELSFRFNLGITPTAYPGHSYALCGHLDQMIDINGDTFIQDHKTASKAPSNYFFEQFNPDNQFSLYTLASQIVYGMKVKGVIIDAAQIGVNFSRFDRGMTYRTPGQIAEWLDDTIHYIWQAERYAAENYWPQNDKSCGNYGGCAFRTVCSRDPSVRQAFLETKFDKGNRWDPTKAR